MQFSSYNPGDRYRKRGSKAVLSFMFMLLLFVVIFVCGFWLGKERGIHDGAILRQSINELTQQNTENERKLVALRSEAQTATMRYDQLLAQYEEELPEGPVRDLLALVRDQLDEGRAPDRLAFLIRSARPPRNCSEIETRRFVVATPTNEGPQNKINVADGLVAVTGAGDSARNDKGLPEAWYDASRPITVEFITEESTESKKGVFPIHHSLVLGAREYRFTIAEGSRSFAKVTYDSCDYP